MSGIVNLNKPTGPTSFDMVRLARRVTGTKRIGHAGTLDPAASGVLLLLLGEATRVTEYLMDLRKTYRASVRLGVETSTYDREGEITRRAVVGVSEASLARALKGFTGEIEQTPPPFSAVKIDGEPAYKKARRGEDLALEPRTVNIYDLRLLRFDPPDAEVDVECSRGTYIRSLAHDLGQRLGCGAHLAALKRTRIGDFSIDDSVSVTEFERRSLDGTWRDVVLPIDAGLKALPSVQLGAEAETALRHGRPVASPTPDTAGAETRAYGPAGALIGIIQYDSATESWKPRKIFAPGQPS